MVEHPWLLHPIEDPSLMVCQHPIEKWRFATYAESMTDAFTESLEAKVAEVATIEDLVERGLAAREAREQMAAKDHELLQLLRASVRTLRDQGRTWAEVGALFGRSHAWAEAIATERSSKRGKAGHAVQPTRSARAAEGHRPDTTAT